jgi:hypothetical protein
LGCLWEKVRERGGEGRGRENGEEGRGEEGE